MAALFRRSLRSLLNVSILVHNDTNHVRNKCHKYATGDSPNEIVNSVCESLRKGMNWDSLSRKYDSVEFNDTVVEEVLLKFKEPTEAKKALSFFHWSSHSKKVEHPIRSYCFVIHILARARQTNDARALLESILLRNVQNRDDGLVRFLVVDSLLNTYKATDSCTFVFDLLVQCYSKLRMFETAFDVCRYLDDHGFPLSLISFNTLLYVIQKSPDKTFLVWKVYEHMMQRRTYPNKNTIQIMISALCKQGDLRKFVDILDRIHGKKCSPSVIISTSLVLKVLDEGRTEEGILLLKRMLQKNMILDTVSYSLIVYAKVQTGDLESAQQVYGEMLRRGFSPNSFVCTSFINAYCKKGMVEEASNLLEEMKDIGLKPYVETYNSLVEGCAEAGKLESGLRFCKEMLSIGLVPSSSVFNDMVKKLCEAGNMEQANEMLTLFIDKGYMPDEVTYFHLISGYKEKGNLQEVLKLYYEMEYRLLSPGLPVFTSLIEMLCDGGKLEEADKYFAVMKSRSLEPALVIYEKLISKHFETGNERMARLLYMEMVGKGLKPCLSSGPLSL